jgi:hypothetical protein
MVSAAVVGAWLEPNEYAMSWRMEANEIKTLFRLSVSEVH